METPFFKSALLLAGVLFWDTSAAATLRAEGTPGGWTEDQPKALEQARAQKKLVFMDFTGSDWCSACQLIDKEVFSTPEFKDFARDHLILVQLDYPQEKPQNPDTRKQNQALALKYDVQGFPTLVILDADGKTLKTIEGYRAGGAKEFIEMLRQLKG